MVGIPVVCQCGKQFLADARRAGQTLACPICSGQIYVPCPDDLLPDETSEPASYSAYDFLDDTAPPSRDLPPQPTPKQRKSRRRTPRDRKETPYQRSDDPPLATLLYFLLVVGAAVLGSWLVGWEYVTTMEHGADGELIEAVMGRGVLVLGGVFCLAAAMFQWEFFFNSFKPRGIRALMGDVATRWLYVAIGVGFIGGASIFAWGNIARQLGYDRESQIAREKQEELESQVRTWQVQNGQESEQFEGVLDNLSSTGATVRRADSSLFGGRFEQFSAVDREYLRDVFGGRDQRVPNELTRADRAISSSQHVSAAGGSATQAAGSISTSPDRTAAGSGTRGSASSVDHGPPPIDPRRSPSRPIVQAPVAVGKARYAVFNNADPPLAAVLELAYPRKIRIYDLTRGTLLAQGEIGSEPDRLLAVSDDGSRVVAFRSSSRELTVWRIGESMQQAGKWGVPRDSWSRFRVISIVGNDRLLTEIDGRVVARSLPEMQEIAGFSIDGVGAACTPGGKYLVAFHRGAFQFHEIQSGRPAGTFRPEIAWSSARGTAISGDGTRLAALVGHERGRQRLACWDLVQRKLLLAAITPNSVRVENLRFLRDGYILCGKALASIEDGGFVWKFEDFHGVDGPAVDDRLWQIESNYGDMALGAVAVPDDELKARIQAGGRARRLLGRGDRVKLDVQFRATPPAGMEDRLVAMLRQKVLETQLKIDPASERTIQVLVEDRSLNRSIVAEVVTERDGPGTMKVHTRKQTLQIPDRSLSVTMQLEHPSFESRQLYRTFCNAKSVPTIELKWRQQATPELLLSKRWDVIEGRLSQATLPDDLWTFDQLGSSAVPGIVTDQWRAERKMAKRTEPAPYSDAQLPKIDLPAAAPVMDWHVKADPHPATQASLLGKPLRVGHGDPKGLLFAPHVGHAAVALEKDETIQLRRFQLRPQKELASTTIPGNSVLADYRPDGQLLLIWPKPDRLVQVWQCDEQTQAPIVEVPVREERDLLQAEFVGYDKLLTFDGQELFCRQLPSGELLYRRRLSAQKCWLSIGRRYFVDVADYRIRLHRTDTGEPVGQLEPLPADVNGIASKASSASKASPASSAKEGGIPINNVAFHPLGETVAIHCGSGGNAYVGVWNLEDGTLKRWFRMPQLPIPFRWTSARSWLLVGQDLYDVNRERKVWTYRFEMLPDTPDGRAWLMGKNQHGAVHLATMDTPSEEVKNAIHGILATTDPWLKRGDAVSLEVELYKLNSALESPYEHWPERAREALQQALTRNHLRVVEGQQPTLRVSLRSHAQRVRNAFRLEAEDREVTLANTPFTATIYYQETKDGRVTWNKEIMVDLPTSDYTLDSGAEYPVTDLLRQQEDALIEQLEQLDLSSLMVPNATPKQPFGQSTLSPKGEQVTIDRNYRSAGE